MRLRDLIHVGPAASASQARQKTLFAVVIIAFILAIMYLAATLVAPKDIRTKLIEGDRGYAIETDKDEYTLLENETVSVRLFVTAPQNSSIKVLRMSFAPIGSGVRLNGFVFEPSIGGKQMINTMEDGTTNLLLYGLDIAGGEKTEIGVLGFDRDGSNDLIGNVGVRVLGDEVLGCSPYHTELAVVETGAEPATINFDTTDLFRIKIGPQDTPTPVPPTPTPSPSVTPTHTPSTRIVLTLIAPSVVERNTPFDLTICARDGSGKPATNYRGRVMLYALGDARANLPRTYTFTGTEPSACKTFVKGATLTSTSARLLFALDFANTKIWGLRRVIVR